MTVILGEEQAGGALTAGPLGEAKAARRRLEAGDEVTASLISDRLTAHEKHVWMLRSSR